MSDNQGSGMSAKNVVVLILVAITVAVVVTLLQVLILGRSNERRDSVGFRIGRTYR